MLSQSSKVFLPLAGLSFVMALAYGMATGNTDGTVLFLGLVVAATFAGVSVSAARENEFAPRVAPDAPPPESHRVAWARPVAGGLWSALGAAAVGLAVCGFIVGPVLAVAGLVVGAAAIVGWMTSVSADHTGRRLDLSPVAIPVVGLFTIFCLMFSISRVLLAVPEQASTVIAIAIAITILGAASLVNFRPNLSKQSLLAVLAVAGVLFAGGGVAAASFGQRTIEKPEGVAPGPVKVAAEGIQFVNKELTVKADLPATIVFDNKDKNIVHNVAVASDAEFTQRIFTGDVVPGPRSIDYRFRAPAAGVYFFRCDIHPAMQGKLTVTK
ncbi:MAG: hypothetical protein V7605_773 [Acidimicrobiaceae bacterium]|jgi:plastocyanin